MRKWVVVVILSFLAGCAAPSVSTPDSKVADRDKVAGDSLAQKGAVAPALAWLADSRHALWKGDRVRIKLHFEEMERSGLKELFAVDIEEVEGTQVCARFVLVLPPVGDEKRKKAFYKYNEFWKAYLGKEASEDDLKEFLAQDQGQKYLTYDFDL